ncbi:MAG: S8 family peptidase [Bacillota bacterium]
MLGHNHGDVRRGIWRGKELHHRQRIVVKFHDRAETPAGGEHPLHETHPHLKLIRKHRTGKHVLRVPDHLDPIRVAHDLSRHGLVEWVEPDQVSTVAVVPNDPYLSQQWGLKDVNLEPYWATVQGSNTVLVGIVDSGIQFDHPDLTAAGRFIAGENYTDPGTAPADDFGHGTHVCGIGCAESNNKVGIAGVNWSSPVYITKVFDRLGFANNSDIAAAIEETVDYAVQHRLKAVINFSGACGAADKTLETACRHVAENGMLLCAAAGNNGKDVNSPALYSTEFPNAVIAVGAIDQTETVAAFSCRGEQLTVVAPGVEIYSTYLGGGYHNLSGTSMATPYVTGLASLIWAANPQFTNEQVRAAVVKAAKKLGKGEFDPTWGYGRIQAPAGS